MKERRQIREVYPPRRLRGIYAILWAIVILSALVWLSAAEAQISGHTMDIGEGWRRHSFSDGTTVYSMPMDGGWYRYSFSDGTTGYSMPLDETPHSKTHAYYPGVIVPYFEIVPLEIVPLNY